MDAALKTYQKRLTNLTAKNRSLLLLRLQLGQSFDLHRLDHVLDGPSFDVVGKLLALRKRFRIAPLLDSRDAKANEASHALRQLHRADRFIQEERGAFDLHVGFPFIQGRMADGTLVRAPLLFFPVSLWAEEGHWNLGIREDAGISFNRSFLLAFAHYNELLIGDELLEEDFLDFPKEPQTFLTELYRKLESSLLEIHFNQQTFEERLQDFEQYTKQRFESITETGQLKAFPQAVLGLFPQAGSQLEPDYAFLEKQADAQQISAFFHSKIALEAGAIKDIVEAKAAGEESLMAPYATDGSQERAMHAVKAGHSIVIQGPPGSGKSQLICNLMADAMSQGKNVLLVCQKKAALDVVYKRLDEKGIADFVALVHDFRNDRKEIYDKINRNIERIEEFKQANNSLDAIYLERNFKKSCRTIDQVSEELETFRQALFDTSECGISVKELYLMADPSLPHINLRREYEHFQEAEAPDLVRKFKSYSRYAQQFERLEYPWHGRVSFHAFGVADQPAIAQAVHEVVPFAANKAWAVAELIAVEVSLDECEWIHDRREQFTDLLALLKQDGVLPYFKLVLESSMASKIWLANRKQNVLSAFGKRGVEKTLDRKQLGQAAHILDEAIKAKQQWLQWMKWRLLSKEKIFVQDLIINNGMEGYEDALPVLLEMVENRMNLEHQLSAMQGHSWLKDMPENYSKQSFEQWFDLYLKALEAKEIYEKLRNGIKYLKLEEFSYAEIERRVHQLMGIVADVPSKRHEWDRYLSRKQQLELEEGKLDHQDLLDALERDFDALCEFDQLQQRIAPHEKDILRKLQEVAGGWDVERMVAIFQHSVRVAWIHHIEAKYPVLRSVASHRLEALEMELRESIDAKQEVCQQMVLMRARERAYKEAAYNRLNNMVTYRELKHQVSKKRSIWPLRKLVSQFSHELLDLMPCWMASPESVSAIFQMDRLFDLVIFDEASQCFAERGLPAMYRGKQVVVVGDSQQLSPYELYQPRWEEDTEDPALEVDSLLDLACQYLPQFPLLGHYRSQALELIDFSNVHFYQSRLRMLPACERFMNDKPAIHYVKVEGQWEKQRNEVEAKAVVQLMRKLVDEGHRSIGVIAFNFLQQESIFDAMEQEGGHWPGEVFVKNIENVQGDERDIIIFSVGYAPGADGRMRFQFGSLGHLKGENRLNVAITRARQQVFVVSSIWPQQLQVEEAKHAGPKLLKAYLEYALEVSEGRFVPKGKPKPVHGPQWLLKNRIQQLADGQVEMRQDLPFADLAVLEPAHTELALTDDDLFHQALMAKEIYGYTPNLLTAKGWRFRRFYSRTYWKERDAFNEAVHRLMGR